MPEQRLDDKTAIIPGPQPDQERLGATAADDAIRSYTKATGVRPSNDQLADISAGVIRGLPVDQIVTTLLQGNSLLPKDTDTSIPHFQEPPRTASQELLGLARVTGRDRTPQELDELDRGITTPAAIIAKEPTRLLPQVPDTRDLVRSTARQQPPPVGRHRR